VRCCVCVGAVGRTSRSAAAHIAELLRQMPTVCGSEGQVGAGKRGFRRVPSASHLMSGGLLSSAAAQACVCVHLLLDGRDAAPAGGRMCLWQRAPGQCQGALDRSGLYMLLSTS